MSKPPIWQRAALLQLIDAVNYETADLDSISQREIIEVRPGEVTGFVRGVTQDYVANWIEPLLRALLDGDRHGAEALTQDKYRRLAK